MTTNNIVTTNIAYSCKVYRHGICKEEAVPLINLLGRAMRACGFGPIKRFFFQMIEALSLTEEAMTASLFRARRGTYTSNT